MTHFQRHLPRALVAIAVAAAAPAALAQAAPFAPAIQLAGQTLALNGQGVRYRAVIPVYDMALYTPRKAATAEQLLAMPGPKRAAFVARREVTGDQFGLSLVRAMRENAEPGRGAALALYVEKLGPIFSTEPKIRAGQHFRLDYVPGKGTTFYLDDVQKGEPVTDAGFIDAVLRIWVGPRPVDRELKGALLGAPVKPPEAASGG